VTGRLIRYLAIFLLGATVGLAIAALQPGIEGGVLVGAVIGAIGAIVGGWVGAYLLRRADDQREKRRDAKELLANRKATAAALVAIQGDAAGNAVDIERFLKEGVSATTGLQDDNFRTYHETLVGNLPADVYYVLAGSYRQLSFARFHYASGKGPDELTQQDKDELEYVRLQALRAGALAQGVLVTDYKDVADVLTEDPRKSIERYLPKPEEAAANE
jgi:uncharacterized membrane protein YeaQ/YmgE (transglycosylase-associated protein family)